MSRASTETAVDSPPGPRIGARFNSTSRRRRPAAAAASAPDGGAHFRRLEQGVAFGAQFARREDRVARSDHVGGVVPNMRAAEAFQLITRRQEKGCKWRRRWRR